jgi:hypothetical protein
MRAIKRGRRASEPSCFDDACVPARVASDAEIRAGRLDLRALLMFSFVDGVSLLGEALAPAGLPLEEAREGVSDLVLRGIVALGVSGREDAWSPRTT